MHAGSSRGRSIPRAPPKEKFNFRSHSWPPSDWNGDNQRFRDAGKQRLSSGSFRDVYLAWDTKTNQTVVTKKFKDGTPTQERFWREDLQATAAAARYADAFNRAFPDGKRIRFIKPLVDYATDAFRPGEQLKPGECVLIEPFIGEDYEKFNSNTGWQNHQCGLTMGAFSHFSYHMSNGQELLCDLQGVKEQDEYVLTDPVICSLAKKYGMTDTGHRGIAAFFRNHRCNFMCRNFSRPDTRGAGQLPMHRGTAFQH